MKESKVTLPEPINLVRAKVRRSTQVWEAFDIPIFGIDENSSETLQRPKGWMRYIGICFAISASVVFSLGALVTKILHEYHALNVSSWRFQGVLIPNIIILSYYGMTRNSSVLNNVTPLSKPGAKRKLSILFLRGLLGGVAVVAHVYALHYLTIPDATVIVFSTPVFITFLAHFILGESLGIVPVLTSIFTLGGVFVITRPPILTGGEMSIDNLIGIGMALACMLTQAAIIIVLRILRDVSSVLLTSSFGIVGIFLCVTIALGCGVFELPNGTHDLLYAIALGVLTFGGQSLFTLALQYEEAGPISLIRCGDVIFTFIWQFIFFGMYPDIFSVVGATIIITGVMIIGFRKWIEGLPEENEKRKRFRFLLL